jgi:hypothetical protein
MIPDQPSEAEAKAILLDTDPVLGSYQQFRFSAAGLSVADWRSMFAAAKRVAQRERFIQVRLALAAATGQFYAGMKLR